MSNDDYKQPESQSNSSVVKVKFIKSRLEPIITFAKAKTDTLDTSFMDGIWNECLDAGYPNETLTSDLWQNMANGTLDPDDYGSFNVQDVAYCANSSREWAKAAVQAQKLGDNDLASYLTEKFVSNMKYADSLRDSWGIEPSGVVLNDATSLYRKVEDYVVNTLGPYYCPVANYACYKLWPWLAQKLESKLKPKDTPNVFYDFIYGNLDGSSAEALAHQIGIYQSEGKIDHDNALKIVANCLYCEAFMARSACDQEMTIDFPYPLSK